MKKAALSLMAVAALASTTFAGHEVVRSSGKEYKGGPTPVPCFKDQEIQLDIFGSYNMGVNDEKHGTSGDNFGGGVGVNFFFARYYGIGIEGNWFAGGANDSAIHQLQGSAILRYPLELGNHLCLAPYVFGGGGGAWDGESAGTGHVGGGLEWRLCPRVGLFSDGRYTWRGGNQQNLVEIRTGVRFAF